MTIKLPHHMTYTRLKQSPIHGIGVFAIRKIPKGTIIFADDNSRQVRIDKQIVKGIDGELRKLYDDFCVITEKEYICPDSFNNLTISWYINEPMAGDESNVFCVGDDYDFIAARDIEEGEELTIDYSKYSEYPN